MMKTTTALSAMLVIAFGLSSPCLAQLKDVTVIQVKNMALQQCLHDSYSRITPGGDSPLNPDHESSYMIQRFIMSSPGNYRTRHEEAYWRLKEYVANADKNFHKQDRSGMDSNIFEQCMDFYASPELDAFVRQLIL